MIVNIVSGSPLVNLSLVSHFKCDYLIGVDYGAYHLINNNIKINAAIGDFDSISDQELNDVKSKCDHVLIYPKEKDETDTEIALNYAFELNPKEINLFGVTGKRIDHFLGAFYLFKKTLLNQVKLNIIDDNNCLYVLKPGTHTIQKNNYRYISFFSFNEVVLNLSIVGFKYKLDHHLLKNENSLCLSNELISKSGTVSFTEGILLIVESND
ncbi:MAG: thiamine diphosphokinase [Haloplasmataceae bacterium]|jgi:thiamine pyrophosphokinase|nr:thiamine diphosphokinase [Haloplasmataceae bacterium]